MCVKACRILIFSTTSISYSIKYHTTRIITFGHLQRLLNYGLIKHTLIDYWDLEWERMYYKLKRRMWVPLIPFSAQWLGRKGWGFTSSIIKTHLEYILREFDHVWCVKAVIVTGKVKPPYEYYFLSPLHPWFLPRWSFIFLALEFSFLVWVGGWGGGGMVFINDREVLGLYSLWWRSE